MSGSILPIRHSSRRVGLFVLIATAVFIISVLQAGILQDFLRSRVTLRVILPEQGLSGLSAGATVEVLGTSAGEVERIVIDPETHFHAVVEVDENMVPFIRHDSTAIIRKQFGIAGASYLEITRGRGEPLDWDYAVIEAQAGQAPTENVGDLIEDVRDRVFPMIEESHRAITAAADLIERVGRGEGTVGGLLVDDTVLRELERGVAALNQTLTQAIAVMDDVKASSAEVNVMSQELSESSKRLPELLDNANNALDSMDAVISGLAETMPQLTATLENVANASLTAPTLLMQTQETLAELEQLSARLRESWLFGGEASGPSSTRLSPLEARP